MEEAAGRPLGTEPGVRTAVPLHQEPDLRTAGPPAAVFRRSAPPLRPDPRLPQPPPHRLPSDPQTLPLRQHLDEVGVVELSIHVLVKLQNSLADLRPQGIAGRLTPAPVG